MGRPLPHNDLRADVQAAVAKYKDDRYAIDVMRDLAETAAIMHSECEIKERIRVDPYEVGTNDHDGTGRLSELGHNITSMLRVTGLHKHFGYRHASVDAHVDFDRRRATNSLGQNTFEASQRRKRNVVDDEEYPALMSLRFEYSREANRTAMPVHDDNGVISELRTVNLTDIHWKVTASWDHGKTETLINLHIDNAQGVHSPDDPHDEIEWNEDDEGDDGEDEEEDGVEGNNEVAEPQPKRHKLQQQQQQQQCDDEPSERDDDDKGKKGVGEGQGLKDDDMTPEQLKEAVSRLMQEEMASGKMMVGSDGEDDDEGDGEDVQEIGDVRFSIDVESMGRFADFLDMEEAGVGDVMFFLINFPYLEREYNLDQVMGRCLYKYGRQCEEEDQGEDESQDGDGGEEDDR